MLLLVAMLTTTIAFGDSQYEKKTIHLTEAERALVVSNNNFAFRLFKEARKDKDLLLSPLSITYALGMLNNGAAGQTQQQIQQVLGFSNADEVNAFCRKMLTESVGLDQETKVNIANTIYVNQGLGYQLQDGFAQKALQYYDAIPEARDFADGQTMQVINQWASDHTQGMIPQVLDADSFDPMAVSYLLNAIYFKGVWTMKFDVDNTVEELFVPEQAGSSQSSDAAPSAVAVPMMHQWNDFAYAENDLYQAIRLPYGLGAYQLTVFLPREGHTVSDVLAQLDGENWQFKGSSYHVNLKLPRFETDVDVNLKDIMSALGMPLAFSSSQAEFPYFCNASIFISLMKQCAKIRVDEEGSEAAAVTIIGTKETAILDPKEVVFHASRPFLYMISEESTGVIFFIGQYMGKNDKLTASLMPSVSKGTDHQEIYDLQGRRVEGTCLSPGIYISNGRKAIVR